MSKFYEYIDESVWSDIQKRSMGKQIRKENEVPEDIKEVLGRYIVLYAKRCYYQEDYYPESIIDFKEFITDAANNIRTEELHPDIKELNIIFTFLN